MAATTELMMSQEVLENDGRTILLSFEQVTRRIPENRCGLTHN